MNQTQEQLPGAHFSASHPEAATHRHPEFRIRLRHCLILLLPLAALSTIAGYQFAGFERSWLNWLKPSQLQADAATPAAALVSVPASKATKTESEIEAISQLVPQQQAERLLELAIQRPDPSVQVIQKNLESWRGHLEDTNHLFHIVLAALEADDTRVRTAALEIDLEANHLSKSTESVGRLLRQIHNDPDGRFLALWRLGALGNRGVEPGTVLSTLVHYAHDANQQIRFWAVEGLGMMGTDESIDPLLSILAEDPAPEIRERAACDLARSGMLSGEQRLSAVPHLLNLLDDDSLDEATQDLVYSALHVITGAALGKEPGAWRDWWAHHDRPEKSHRVPKNLLTA
jgi:HEAT repeat protein